MSAAFALTLFLSAGLMFAVQPMLAKMLLPLYGGTPALWNTCMVFFQALLLAGYGYVHLVTRLCAVRRQMVVHLALLLLSVPPALLVLLPLGALRHWTAPSDANPIPWILALLTAAVGVPFFTLSATAPLLQKWFAGTRHQAARDPYFLYAASNLGSLLALVGYPLLLEPTLSLQTQGRLWSGGFAGLFAATLVCALLARRSLRRETRIEGLERLPLPASLGTRFRWLALAFVPSSLLFGATTYLSTDIASVPLLWVLPLALYLLTFILVFARRPLLTHEKLVHLLPLAILWQTFVFALQRPIGLIFLLHLLTFFVVALVCHGELAHLRPSPRHLTTFYLWLSAGGVLGGLFNALLAPFLFDSLVEYPLGFVLACFLVPTAPQDASRRARAITWNDLWLPLFLFILLSSLGPDLKAFLRHLPLEVRLALQVSLLYGLPAAIVYFFRGRPLRFGLGVAALLLAGGMANNRQPDALVFRERSFFGIVRVVDFRDDDVVYRRFVHGSTLHGLQRLSDDPVIRRQPLSYYFTNGPTGEIFAARMSRPQRQVAVLGLGAGTLASYADAGQEWTFYEIDPAVHRVAETYFDFLGDARTRGAAVDVVLGDARLRLAEAPTERFDLIFADAFSSDAVPVHLLTREALELYLSRLAPGGVLVFNVTNRYLDLEPVLAELATDAGLAARIAEEIDILPEGAVTSPLSIDPADKKRGKAPSRWVVLARTESDLDLLTRRPRWRPLRSQPDVGVWTDDYSNLVRVIRW